MKSLDLTDSNIGLLSASKFPIDKPRMQRVVKFSILLLNCNGALKLVCGIKWYKLTKITKNLPCPCQTFHLNTQNQQDGEED